MAQLAADDLITPNGPLETYLFPGDDLAAVRTRITGALAQAYTDDRVTGLAAEATQNKAAKALTLYTIYMAVYQRMLSEPLTVTVTEKGGHVYSTKQIDAMQALADQKLAIVDGLQPDEPSPTEKVIQPTSARVCVSWG